MKNVEAIIKKLDEAGITIYNYEEDEVLLGYELNTYTEGGVNQIIFLDFRNSGLNPTDAEDFLKAYNERILDINIDDEIESNREDPSYKAVFTMREALEDFEEWKLKLETIFKG